MTLAFHEFKYCMKRVWDQCKLHCKNAENNLLAHTIAELSEVRDGLAYLGSEVVVQVVHGFGV